MPRLSLAKAVSHDFPVSLLQILDIVWEYAQVSEDLRFFGQLLQEQQLCQVPRPHGLLDPRRRLLRLSGTFILCLFLKYEPPLDNIHLALLEEMLDQG